MLLKDYIVQTDGLGVLSTADSDGAVNSAIYAKPHIADDGRAAFLMRERLTWHNIEDNPKANYLFVEAGHGYRGIRMRLHAIGEERNDELIARMTRSWLTPEEDRALGTKHLVWFRIEQVLNLIGDAEADMSWH